MFGATGWMALLGGGLRVSEFCPVAPEPVGETESFWQFYKNGHRQRFSEFRYRVAQLAERFGLLCQRHDWATCWTMPSTSIASWPCPTMYGSRWRSPWASPTARTSRISSASTKTAVYPHRSDRTSTVRLQCAP